MSRVTAVLLIGAVAGAAWGQESAGADGDRAAALLEPVPYERSEFPDWAHALRRAEVVAIGSLPLTLFGVRLLYDYTRYVARGFAPEVRPFPFGRSRFRRLRNGDARTSSAGVSVASVNRRTSRGRAGDTRIVSRRSGLGTALRGALLDTLRPAGFSAVRPQTRSTFDRHPSVSCERRSGDP